MFLKDFYSSEREGLVISAHQASLFAKEIAGDFNPIHDADSKRFCVPGDLLFSLVLEKYGISQQMTFTFAGMVGHGVSLIFPDSDAQQIDITDQNGKTYLKLERSGNTQKDDAVIEQLVKDYVAFSGQNFPYILVPLLEKENVMFNQDRPLVIYNSMTIQFEHMDFHQPFLEMLTPDVEVNGKRATADLHFHIKSEGRVVGSGYKKLSISGLRPYETEPMQAFIDDYLARKDSYQASVVE